MRFMNLMKAIAVPAVSTLAMCNAYASMGAFFLINSGSGASSESHGIYYPSAHAAGVYDSNLYMSYRANEYIDPTNPEAVAAGARVIWLGGVNVDYHFEAPGPYIGILYWRPASRLLKYSLRQRSS